MSIESNKAEFINLFKSNVSREGVTEFLDYLERETDFYTAPASTVYHSDFEGGLCEHTLNVYKNVIKLAELFCPNKYSLETLTLVSLLHDLSKVNFYEKSIVNKKVYSPNGSKYDDLGRFDWKSFYTYKIKEKEFKYVAGTHGFNSYFMAKKFFNLNDEEALAIVHHHAGMDEQSPLRDLDEILHRNQLIMLLHLADMGACYFQENKVLDE